MIYKKKLISVKFSYTFLNLDIKLQQIYQTKIISRYVKIINKIKNNLSNKDFLFFYFDWAYLTD
jgi:hypothetical protein